MEPKLNPCPYCGEDEWVSVDYLDDVAYFDKENYLARYVTRCHKCKTEGVPDDTREAAAENWNEERFW